MRKAKDWNQPCPNPGCDHYKLMNRGNISAIATYATQSGTRRIFNCSHCGESFSETRDTVFFDLRTEEERLSDTWRGMHYMLQAKIPQTSTYSVEGSCFHGKYQRARRETMMMALKMLQMLFLFV